MSDVNVYLVEINWLVNVNTLVKYFPIDNNFLGKCSFDGMTAYRRILSLGEKGTPTTHTSQAGLVMGLIQMLRTTSLPRADILFIHHTSSIRSLIHVQAKTTAKLLDYREKLLRHLSHWWKQHGPLTFAGSRSVMRQVRQEEQRVRLHYWALCAHFGALRLLSISVGRLQTADHRRLGMGRRRYLYCCTLLHFN